MKAFCHIPVAPLRADASDRSEMVDQVLFGDSFDVLERQEKWTRVRCAYNYEGWIDNKQCKILSCSEAAYVDSWPIVTEEPMVSISVSTPLLCGGAVELVPMLIPMGSRLPKESRFHVADMTFEHSVSLSEVPPFVTFDKAFKLLNAPYQWGGKSCMGIDCSGFTQVVYKVYGYSLMRDASQQAEQGNVVSSLDDTERGDLLFFSNLDGRIIHVGIKFGKGTVIHASGRVRVDRVDAHGIYNLEEGRYTHRLHSIRRVLE